MMHLQHAGDNDTLQADLDKQTEKQLESIRSMFGSNKQAVVDKLLERVIEVSLVYVTLPLDLSDRCFLHQVEPALHKNYKKPASS